MQIIYDNFLCGLDDPSGLVLAPTCGVLTKDGNLVMGAGAAKALAMRLPGIAKDLGLVVTALGVRHPNHHWVYGLAVTKRGPHLVGGFQTKGHWLHPAKLDLIRLAAKRLREYLNQHPDLRAHLAYPGVGLGGLPIQEVDNILAEELQTVANRVLLYLLKPKGNKVRKEVKT